MTLRGNSHAILVNPSLFNHRLIASMYRSCGHTRNTDTGLLTETVLLMMGDGVALDVTVLIDSGAKGGNGFTYVMGVMSAALLMLTGGAVKYVGFVIG